MSPAMTARCDSSLSTRSSASSSSPPSGLCPRPAVRTATPSPCQAAVSTHSVIVKTRTYRHRTQYLVQLWPYSGNPASTSAGGFPVAILPELNQVALTRWQKSLMTRESIPSSDQNRRPCGVAIYSPSQPGKKIAEKSLRRIINQASRSQAAQIKSLKRKRGQDESRSSSPEPSILGCSQRPTKYRVPSPAFSSTSSVSAEASGVFITPCGSHKSLAGLRATFDDADSVGSADLGRKQQPVESRLRQLLGF